MSDVIERFLEYVQIDTQSDDTTNSSPSTAKQFDLARLLTKQLIEMGAKDVRLDEEHCYVYATIPATTKEDWPVLGLIAHMDTAPDASGANVKPTIKEYDGGDLCINEEKQIYLTVKDFPEMQDYVGKHLIVTDGTTLLGADDKAGVSEIMSTAKYLLEHKEIEHGTLRIAFTPDEEIGEGPNHFDVKGFGADYAYTVDGGALGEIEFENFNAAAAEITIHGRSVHPGDSKNKMINAILIGMELENALPAAEKPMFTEGYEGFFHLDEFNGGVEITTMSYIIRDHDMDKFKAKKELMENVVASLNEKYGMGTVDLDLKDSYFNMAEIIKENYFLIDNAKKAFEKTNIPVKIIPIRGGTDGARLSFMGLPCPNLCTGGHNFHGRFEYCVVESMEKIVEMLINLVQIPMR